jgi:hypothetical protein
VILTIKRTERCRRAQSAKVLTCIEGHYDSEKVPFVRVYRWRPKYIVAECDSCGESMTLTSFMTTYVGCGTDYADIARRWVPAERAPGHSGSGEGRYERPKKRKRIERACERFQELPMLLVLTVLWLGGVALIGSCALALYLFWLLLKVVLGV